MRRLLGILFLAGTVLASCKKETGVPGPAGPQGSPGPNYDTGTVQGAVLMYNELSLPLQNRSGVIVTLIEGVQLVNDTTDSSGHYTFHNVLTGTYNLTFSKQGYGTMKIFGFSFFAGGNAPTPSVEDVYLLQIPRATVPIALSMDLDSGLVKITLDTPGTSYTQYQANFIVYFGKDRNVGPSDYISYVNNYFVPDGAGYSSFYYYADLSKFGPGDSLFAVGYTYNMNVHIADSLASSFMPLPGANSIYLDPATDVWTYPNLSAPSPLVGILF